MEMLVGGVVLLGIATLSGEWGRLDLAAVTTRSWLGLAYLIVFGALIGFVAYTWLLRSAPTPLVSTYAYVNPLIAIFLGAWLGQESLTPRILLACAGDRRRGLHDQQQPRQGNAPKPTSELAPVMIEEE